MKITSNGVVKGSRVLLLEFWDPLKSYKLQFGTHIDRGGF